MGNWQRIFLVDTCPIPVAIMTNELYFNRYLKIGNFTLRQMKLWLGQKSPVFIWRIYQEGLLQNDKMIKGIWLFIEFKRKHAAHRVNVYICKHEVAAHCEFKSPVCTCTAFWELSNVTNNPPTAAYMRQWIGSVLVQIMACLPFCTKPLSNPMLGL